MVAAGVRIGMATAVQTTTQAAPPNPRTRLVVASVVGAVVVLAGLAAALYVVPYVWRDNATLGSGFGASLTRLAAQVAVVAGFGVLASVLAGKNPPHGIRGGIFLVISAVVGIFFIVRTVGLNLEESSLAQYAQVITLVVLGALAGLTIKFLTSDRGETVMHAVDDQGLLNTYAYKRTQGLKARRYTLMGLLLIGWSGVYSIVSHDMVRGDWNLKMPFTGDRVWTLLTDTQYTVPILLAALVFWLAWRVVNMPAFADFLIATEAEMNKVAWSSRKQLVQDTIVVLITLALMTLFFLVVDFFWGWLLSRSFVGVLPSRTATTDNRPPPDPIKGRLYDW